MSSELGLPQLLVELDATFERLRASAPYCTDDAILELSTCLEFLLLDEADAGREWDDSDPGFLGRFLEILEDNPLDVLDSALNGFSERDYALAFAGQLLQKARSMLSIVDPQSRDQRELNLVLGRLVRGAALAMGQVEGRGIGLH